MAATAASVATSAAVAARWRQTRSRPWWSRAGSEFKYLPLHVMAFCIEFTRSSGNPTTPLRVGSPQTSWSLILLPSVLLLRCFSVLLLRPPSSPSSPQHSLFFGSFTPHRSGANGSDRRRRLILLTYGLEREGDWYERYFADKAATFPPDCRRETSVRYTYEI